MASGPSSKMWKRMFSILIAILIAFIGCIGALARITLIKANEYKLKAANQIYRDATILAKRGTIYDRNGKVLAESAPVFQVYIKPKEIKPENAADKKKIVDFLSEFLNVDREKVDTSASKDSVYETVGKPVEQKEANKIRSFINDNKFGNIIGLDESSKRYYPYDNLASVLIGFVGTDEGLSGLEAKYEKDLKGTNGKVMSNKNAKGEDMPFAHEIRIEPRQGNSLVLTIDEFIQHKAEEYLERAIIECDVKSRGVVIAMDVNTGGILAMATKPDFNLNTPFEIGDEKLAEEINKLAGDERKKAVTAAQNEQWRNKAVSDAYEPGSVSKIITGAAALEEGKTNFNSNFYCGGGIDIADRHIGCHQKDGHGSQTLIQAFQNSCNPAFIEIGQKLGAKTFCDYRRNFGLETPTGIDLSGEGIPIFHPFNEMRKVELASESFGQTFKVTPIQFITAIAASVNGGYLHQPHVVSQIIDADGKIVSKTGVVTKRQVISEDTSAKMRTLLEAVVSSGTGKNAYVPGYKIMGKTGTSQKIDLLGSSGGERKLIASFCGIAPADNPQVAILVLLDEPGCPVKYGGTIAAPVAGKIFADILPYMQITPVYTEAEKANLEKEAPSVVGLAAETAKNKITADGLKYKIIGSGDTVVRQVPVGTALIPKGGTIIIYTDVNEEKRTVQVPDFTGLTPYNANAAAVNAGLNIRFNHISDNSHVYAQNIEKGKEVEAGTIITLDFRTVVAVD